MSTWKKNDNLFYGTGDGYKTGYLDSSIDTWYSTIADVRLLPARLMPDEEHFAPPYDTHYDEDTDIFGLINSMSPC